MFAIPIAMSSVITVMVVGALKEQADAPKPKKRRRRKKKKRSRRIK